MTSNKDFRNAYLNRFYFIPNLPEIPKYLLQIARVGKTIFTQTSNYM